jgi:hypothetical protein
MKIETKVSTWGVAWQCLLTNLDRPFFHKNIILKQKRMAGSGRVIRNLK